MLGAAPHFVHDLDPVLLELGPVRLYYYGLAYALGFAGLHLWLSRRRPSLGWPVEQTYDFSIVVSSSVLLLGRAFEIVVYEWEYFVAHPSQLVSYWRGGMASHGVLLGGVVGIAVFSRLRGRRFVAVADELAIPSALFLAVGRLGNFVNGEIVGTVTEVPWAVKFPGAEGFRHPVALYESLKNLLLIPILVLVWRRGRPGRGLLMAHFILWYGLLRLLTDYFREYGTTYLGVGAGQYFNLLMALLGLGLLIRFARSGDPPPPAKSARLEAAASNRGLWIRRVGLASILGFYLLIPSSWSRGALEFYRERGAAASRPAAPAQSEPAASLSWIALPRR